MKKKRIAVVLCIAMVFSITACGSGNKNSTKETNKQTTTEKKTWDTSISSGYYLSLGTLEKKIERTGEERSKSEVTVQESGKSQKVVFSLGTVESMSIGSWSRKEKAYNPKKAKMHQYLDLLENAEVVKEVPSKVMTKNPRIETHLVYLNGDGDYRTILIETFGDGYERISVEKDKKENFSQEVFIKMQDGKKLESVALKSVEAEKMVKNWIKWEDQGEGGFSNVEKVTFTNQNGSVKLTEEEIEKLKKYVSSDKNEIESPCGSDNYFECVQKNGSKFHFSISGDGDCISTDKCVYEVIDGNNEDFVKFINQVGRK